MDELLTIAEIEAKFDSEWILIEDPSTDEALAVRSGTVLWHDKDREEVYRRPANQPLSHFTPSSN